MKHITVNSIEKAIQKVDSLNEDSLEKLAETYALAQQTLLGYVMSASVEYENDKLEGLLIYYYCLISEAFTQEQVSLELINDDHIEAFEEGYFEALDQYFNNDDIEILHAYCDQPDLTNFMMVEVSTADEDGTTLEDETATQLFIVIMAMITLMGRAIKK